MTIKALLFPRKVYQTNVSLFLLVMRLLFGSLLVTHGFAKLTGFSAMEASFPDPLGVGSLYSLMLAVFAELFCSVAFIFGFLYRLSLLPMMTTMGVAFFLVHGGSVKAGELALIYFVVFVLMFLAGPGKYSLDSLMFGGKRR